MKSLYVLCALLSSTLCFADTYFIYGQKVHLPFSRSSNILVVSQGGEQRSFAPFGQLYQGDISVATGDVDGDGVADIIAGSEDSRVTVFSGANGNVLQNIKPFGGALKTYVAAGDIDGDGKADIVVGAGPGGGPHVMAFQGMTGKTLHSFYAYEPSFSGGVRVAVGDVNGDGRADIITAPGPGGGPLVRAFNGRDLTLLHNFYAYADSVRTGLYIAAGDLNGDGKAEILTSPDAGVAPHVKSFDGPSGQETNSFYGFEPSFTGGVRIAYTKSNLARCKGILVFAGPGGGPVTKIFDRNQNVVFGKSSFQGLGGANPGFSVASATTSTRLAIPNLPIGAPLRQANLAQLIGTWNLEHHGILHSAFIISANGTAVESSQTFGTVQGGIAFFRWELSKTEDDVIYFYPLQRLPFLNNFYMNPDMGGSTANFAQSRKALVLGAGGWLYGKVVSRWGDYLERVGNKIR